MAMTPSTTRITGSAAANATDGDFANTRADRRVPPRTSGAEEDGTDDASLPRYEASSSPFRASIKDGYAVMAFDGPGEYPMITESRAGDDALGMVVAPGTVAYVTTGGPIPDGADAVVQVEDTEQVAGVADMPKRVRILVRATEGQDIRPVGCDIEKDSVVLKSGEHIGPAEIRKLQE